jgi:hypothetical protein
VSSDKTKKRLRYLLFKFNCDGEVASRKWLSAVAKI